MPFSIEFVSELQINMCILCNEEGRRANLLENVI